MNKRPLKTDGTPYFEYDDAPETAPIYTPTYESQGPQKLFDITCVVGSVYTGGDEDPRVVAFHLIGQAGHDGAFSFPDLDGSIIHVEVSTEPPPNAK